MEALQTLVTGALCIVCFLVGAKVGQTVSRGEEIKLSTVNPLELHREKESKLKAEQEQSKIDTILQNIEKYDGTSRGQEDVPWR